MQRQDIENKDISKKSGKPHRGAESYINEHFNRIEPGTQQITFPQADCNTLLSANDYELFLSSLHKKYPHFLPHLLLTATEKNTVELLKGLEQFYSNNEKTVLRISKITLQTVNSDIQRWKILLQAMKDKAVPEIIISDEKIKKEVVEEIVDYVTDEDLVIPLTLPAKWQQTNEQCKLDELYSDRSRLNKTNIQPEQIVAIKNEDKPKIRRTRTRAQKKSNVSIDIEMQQEQQAEAASEVAAEDQNEQEVSGEDLSISYSRAEFLEWLGKIFDHNEQEFMDSDILKFYLERTNERATSAIWNMFEGLPGNDHPAMVIMSHNALHEIMSYRSRFIYGIDFTNLPAGFSKTIRSDGKTVLKFDEKLKQISTYNPLKVQCIKLAEAKPLSASSFKTWYETDLPSETDKFLKDQWSEILKSGYDRNVHQTFRKYLPKLRRLQASTLGFLMNIIFSNKKFNATALQYLMENTVAIQKEVQEKADTFGIEVSAEYVAADIAKLITTNQPDMSDAIKKYILGYFEAENNTLLSVLMSNDQRYTQEVREDLELKVTEIHKKVIDINESALLELYDQHGEPGINKLYNLIDRNEALFVKLNSVLFSKMESIAPLLTDQYQVAMQAITGFTQEEREWWDKLLEQHCEAQGADDLVHLVNAFKAFRTKLNEYGGDFQFYQPCNLKDVKSLPTALSRIIAILENCTEEERLLQWKCISDLDLSGTGIAFAMSETSNKEEKWKFFHPAQRITQAHMSADYICYKPYTPHKKWKHIHAVKGKEVDKEYRQRFFRYVGFQPENGNLPLNFYHEADKMLQKSKLPEKVISQLYALLADATTGQITVSRIKSTDQALLDVKGIISSFTSLPVPDIFFENSQLGLAGMLYDLTNSPSLPIFVKLVKFIGKSLKCGYTELPGRIVSLQKSCVELNRLVAIYSHSIYIGMKDYVDEDFDDNQLFDKFLAAVECVDKHLPKAEVGKHLVQLISSFRLENISELTTFAEKIAKLDDNGKQAINACFEILNDLLQNQLTIANLNYIVDYVLQQLPANKNEVLYTLPAIKLDGKHLADYFPQGYFENRNEITLTKNEKAKLSQHFNVANCKQITTLLKQFSDKKDQPLYSNAIDKLVSIAAKSGSDELQLLIDKLSDKKLFINIGIDSFNHLLDLLQSKKSVDVFIYFISEWQLFVKNNNQAVRGICEKACLYLEAILPQLADIRNKQISKHDLMSLSTSILLHTEYRELSANPEKYTNDFVKLFEKVNQVCDENRISKHAFIELMQTYISHYQKDESYLLPKLLTFTRTLNEFFSQIENKNTVLALCVNFNNAEKKNSQPENLLNLINLVNTLSKEKQGLVLKIVVPLINTNTYSYKRLSELVDKIRNDMNGFADFLDKVYTAAPYPSLRRTLGWYEKASKAERKRNDASETDIVNKRVASSFTETLNNKFSRFDKKPYRRTEYNGFKIDEACKQLQLFSEKSLTKENLEFLARETKARRKVKTESLLSDYNKIKNSDVAMEIMLANMAELLYRSTGMEIHSTQYLAILSTLKTGGHITSGIGTGEGKSRIMMLALACQCAMGKTVDFVSADLQLVTRDYVEFQPFFELLGIKTSMIFADSKPEAYIKGGINFSDPENLSLFRNKAFCDGKGDLVLDKDKSKRALLLDEADKLYYDMADTRFNYSMAADEAIKDMEWIYPLLIDYLDENCVIDGVKPLDLYYDDVNECNELFMLFAASRCNEEQLARIRSLSIAQIEQWHESAVAALQLEYNKDYIIQPDALISTPQGLKMSSEVKVLIGNRVSRNSSFSFGIQQCRQAKCNKDRKSPDTIKTGSPHYVKILGLCHYPFHIANEKTDCIFIHEQELARLL